MLLSIEYQPNRVARVRVRGVIGAPGDRQRWALDDKLGQIIDEIEVRSCAAREKRVEREAEEAERRRRRDVAIENAKVGLRDSHRAKVLLSEIQDWRTANELRAYLWAQPKRDPRNVHGGLCPGDEMELLVAVEASGGSRQLHEGDLIDRAQGHGTPWRSSPRSGWSAIDGCWGWVRPPASMMCAAATAGRCVAGIPMWWAETRSAVAADALNVRWIASWGAA